MWGLGLFSDHAEYHTRILPILFYTVVLRPYAQDFTSTEWFPEYEHCSDFATVCKEQHHDFSKSWTCGFSPIDRFIAPPLIGEELDRLFMFREFRPFFINRHHIVAFSVHKDRFKSRRGCSSGLRPPLLKKLDFRQKMWYHLDICRLRGLNFGNMVSIALNHPFRR